MKTMRMFAAMLAMSLSAPAVQAFEAEFDALPPQAIALGEITIGETLAAKTREYGEREVEQLVQALRGDLERELRRIGRLADGAAAGGVLNVVLEDAMPNRPTPQQQAVGSRPRDPRGGGTGPMDPRSIFVGGAHVSATLTGTDGALLGRFDYSWRTRPDVLQSQDAVTWTDASRTFDRFAKRLADAIARQGA